MKIFSLGEKNSRDIWLALTILLCSSVVSIRAYAHLSKGEQNDGLLISRIPMGEKSFLVLSEKNCIGNIRSITEEEELTRIRVEVEFDAAVIGRSRPFRLVFDSFFNPLGQLVRARGDLFSAGTRITIKSAGVHPIDVNASFENGAERTEHNIRLPGPIQIEKEGQEYRIIYSQLRTQALLTGQLSELNRLVPLRVVSASEFPNACTEQNRGPLNLDPAMKRFLGLFTTNLGQ